MERDEGIFCRKVWKLKHRQVCGTGAKSHPKFLAALGGGSRLDQGLVSPLSSRCWFLLWLFWMKHLKHQTVIQEDEIRSGSWNIPMTTWSMRDWSSYIGYVYKFIEVRGSSFHVFLIAIPDLNVQIEGDTFLALCMLDKWWDNVSVQVGIRSIGTDRTGTWIEISPKRIFKISHTSWEFPFFAAFASICQRSFLRTTSMRWSSYIHENLGGPSLVKVQSPCLKLAWLSRSC